MGSPARPISRRRFLAGSAASALAFSLPRALRAEDSRTLTIATRQLEVEGKAATVYGLTGPDGQPGLAFGPGDSFAVTLQNKLAEPTLVHWHGMTEPWRQDGVPGLSQPALPPGQNYAYSFPLNRSGTFWMHSHYGLQEQQLLAAPMILRDQAAVSADEQEVVVLLHDFSFCTPEEILASLRGGGASAGGMAGMSGMSSMSSGSSGMANTSSGGMSGMAGMASAAGMAPDINDYNFDAYLANDRTLADPEVVRVEKGGRIRLRIINGAAATGFWIDLGPLAGELIAVDGDAVQPIKGSLFPISMAQRLDIRLSLPADGRSYPVLAIREGDSARTGILLAPAGAAIPKLSGRAAAKTGALTLALERKLQARQPLAPRKPDRLIEIGLAGNMQGYQWSMVEAGKPAAPLVKAGERVEIRMRNLTMMSHPMHLHGHHFQVVAIDGQRFAGAMRDTVLVTPLASVTIAFDADNPGRWAFHCHHLYHMSTGMMSTLAYEGVS